MNILRRDSHMFSLWTWDAGRVRSPAYWHRTSRRWWVSTSVRHSLRQPELCQGTRTYHTGWSASSAYLNTLCQSNLTSATDNDPELVFTVFFKCSLFPQGRKSRGASVSRWICWLADSSLSSPLVWSAQVSGWGKPGFKTTWLHGCSRLPALYNEFSLSELRRQTHSHLWRGGLHRDLLSNAYAGQKPWVTQW